MNRTFELRVLMGLLPIGCPLGDVLGNNRCTSCFSFGKSFFLTIIVPELECFIIECFYSDTVPNRNVFTHKS